MNYGTCGWCLQTHKWLNDTGYCSYACEHGAKRYAYEMDAITKAQVMSDLVRLGHVPEVVIR